MVGLRGLVLERQGDLTAVTRREVGGDQQFQGFEPFAAIGLGLGLATEAIDDVFVVEWVAEAVDAGGLVVGGLDLFVVSRAVRRSPRVGCR